MQYDRAERVRRGLEAPDGTVLALTAEEAAREVAYERAFSDARGRGLSERACRDAARAAIALTKEDR